VSLCFGHTRIKWLSPFRSKTDDNGAELKQQQELFTKTITTLEDRLAKQDEKLRNLCGSDSHLSGKDTEEKLRLLSEKASTQQCISLCTAFSKQIELHREQMTANRKALRDPVLRSRAEQVTEGSLNTCGDEMTQASSTLHRTAEQIDKRLLEMMSMHERNLHELQEEMKQREAERDATKDMLKLCLEYKAEAANQHACIFQDMVVEEGGFQMIINTKGGGITASGGKTARMACQVGGEMEDATAQKITESHFISIRGSPSRYRSKTLQSVHE
jgi:chromosome segregation ATPase